MSIVHHWPRLYALGDFFNEIFVNMLCYWRLKKRNEPDKTVRLDGQTVIVTGGNRGFGAGITKDMVARGARVIVACRDTQKADGLVREIKAANASASIVVKCLDLSSFNSVKAFAREILEAESRIDVLINNSGTITTDPVLITDDGNERIIQVNYLSHVLLMCLLSGKMKSTSIDPRVVFVSSLAHHRPVKIDLKDIPKKALDRYSLSKIAVMMLVQKLASAWPEFPIRTYSVDPGMSATDLVKGMSEHGRNPWLFNSFLIQQLMRSPMEGSHSIIFPVISDRSTYESNSWYTQDGVTKKPASKILDQILIDKIWRQTFEIIDIPEIF